MREREKLTWYNLGRKPTSSTSEAHVSIAKDSKPWQTASEAKPEGDFKYKYYPGGNPANPAKEAPSAMHSVVIPNLNLPKVCLENSLVWLGGVIGSSQDSEMATVGEMAMPGEEVNR